MFRFRVIVVFSIMTVCTLLWAGWPSEAATSGPNDSARVRLYSNGRVVGEWKAVGAGRVEDDTFVFPVREGVRALEVRISGTFSWEAQP